MMSYGSLIGLFYFGGCSVDISGSWKVVQRSPWKNCKLETRVTTNLKVYPCPSKSMSRCNCLATLVDLDGAAASDWVPFVDQVLLMASIFLTYMAGVIPSGKSSFDSRKIKVDENWIPESDAFSGR